MGENSSLEEGPLGYNQRKLLIFRAIRARQQVQRWGCTHKYIAKELEINTSSAAQRLKCYYGWGYLEREKKSCKDAATGKVRKMYLYRLAEKGTGWLDKVEALVAKGYEPRPGRYKLPDDGALAHQLEDSK